MIIVFPNHKGDKEGKNATPKHVYANPLNPAICPILAFAVYMWTSGFHRDGANPSLFGDGVDATEDRFSTWLRKICTKYQLQFLEMGMHITLLNWAIISAPHHPVIAEVMKNAVEIIKRAYFSDSVLRFMNSMFCWEAIMCATGPSL
jgi:hypothetical protein